MSVICNLDDIRENDVTITVLNTYPMKSNNSRKRRKQMHGTREQKEEKKIVRIAGLQ
jgi:hypothetical protein